MAKVIGPLFSQEARGQFGQSLVFTRRRGQNVVRGYAIPSNPQTDAQVAVRIALAVGGLVAKRVRATDWTYALQTESWIQWWSARVTTGEVWNSALVRGMLGPGNAVYNAAVIQYAALDAGTTALWQAEATGTIGGLLDYTRNTTTATAGFQLFLAQLATANSGYNGTFDEDQPYTLVSAP